MEIAKNLEEEYEDRIVNINNNTLLRGNWLVKFIEEIILKYLTGRGDLHLGNLGVTNQGNFRYFDPAYTGWENRINY